MDRRGGEVDEKPTPGVGTLPFDMGRERLPGRDDWKGDLLKRPAEDESIGSEDERLSAADRLALRHRAEQPGESAA